MTALTFGGVPAGALQISSMSGIGAPVGAPQICRFVPEITWVTLHTRLIPRRGDVQPRAVTRLTKVDVGSGDGAVNGPRVPAGGVGIGGVTTVTARTLCDPGRRNETDAVASCRGTGGTRVGDHVVAMFLRLTRGTTPPGLGVGIRGVTGEAGWISPWSPNVIGPVTELTLQFFRGRQGILPMSIVGSPIGGGELVVRIGEVAGETVLSVRFDSPQIGAVAGLTGAVAVGIDRTDPLPVAAGERQPTGGGWMGKIGVTGVAIFTVQNGPEIGPMTGLADAGAQGERGGPMVFSPPVGVGINVVTGVAGNSRETAVQIDAMTLSGTSGGPLSEDGGAMLVGLSPIGGVWIEGMTLVA